MNIHTEENEEWFSNFLDKCNKAKFHNVACKLNYVGNRLPLINKTLSKEIMKRTKLRIKFLKHRNNYTKNESNKQHTYYVSCQKIKIVIMKKKLQIMKLFGRPLNHF